jgi:amino acid transporter
MTYDTGAHPNTPPDSRAALGRRLGTFSAAAVLIGSTIGSGIFRTPASIAGLVPSAGAMLLIWTLGGALVLCGVLTLAELAVAYPKTGGVYVFIREGWGRLPAFLFGWAELVAIHPLALAAIAITFAEYGVHAVAPDLAGAALDQTVHLVAAGAILLLAIVNILGVRWTSMIVNWTTALKYGALVALAIVALIALVTHTGHGAPATPQIAPSGASITPVAVGVALVAVMWAYDGWADLTYVAGEVKDPQRALPIALIGGIVAVVTIYIVTNLAYLAVLSIDEIRNAPLVAAVAADRVLGRPGVIAIAATVVISTFGSLDSTILTTPRIFFAMASDGLFVRRVASVHPRFGTPYVAISISAVLGITCVMFRTFEQLADMFVTAVVPFYILGVASVYMLRRKSGYNPSYRVPGYPVTPAIFVIAATAIVLSALIDPGSRWGTVVALGVVLAGIPVYYATVGRRGARPVALDANVVDNEV